MRFSSKHHRRPLAGLAATTAILLLAPVGAAVAQDADPPFDRGIGEICTATHRGFDPFPDNGPATHYEAINCLAFVGVTNGSVVDGVPHYLPSNHVTRAQMATFLTNVLDAVDGYSLPNDAPSPFSDAHGHHGDNIDRLAAAGIVEGYDDGTYRPDEDVRRDQMASFVAATIEDVTGEPLPTADAFSDEISDAHVDSVQKLAAIGVVQGDAQGRYGGGEAITRAQMASFLTRAMDHLVAEGESISSDTPVFPQPVGSFTTDLEPGQDRNHNIHLAARTIDGDVIQPGDRYSLDEAIGPRTRERGYQGNGFIDEDGELVSVVGGGISQVATTFFNAAWYAGVELLDHQPHSQYFERYPPGRESTISRGTIDVVIENDTPFPIEIATAYDETFVRVVLIGTPWGAVTADWIDAPDDPRSGEAFSVDYGRTVTYPDGSSSDDAFSWTYSPAP